MDEINKQFEPSVKLALALSKIVHDRCKNVPHDIGLILAEEVICHMTSHSNRRAIECAHPRLFLFQDYQGKQRCMLCGELSIAVHPPLSSQSSEGVK